jgi:hypothetical protein
VAYLEMLEETTRLLRIANGCMVKGEPPDAYNLHARFKYYACHLNNGQFAQKMRVDNWPDNTTVTLVHHISAVLRIGNPKPYGNAAEMAIAMECAMQMKWLATAQIVDFLYRIYVGEWKRCLGIGLQTARFTVGNLDQEIARTALATWCNMEVPATPAEPITVMKGEVPW